jgi:hypothetical protein
VLKHLAHNALADRDVPGETDDVFVFPTAHDLPSGVSLVTDFDSYLCRVTPNALNQNGRKIKVIGGTHSGHYEASNASAPVTGDAYDVSRWSCEAR